MSFVGKQISNLGIMKKILFISSFVIILFSFSALVFAGAVITDFQGEPGLNRVDLKWIVTAESAVKGYTVMRSMDGLHFDKVAFVKTKTGSGEKTYDYIDKSVFKPNGRSFYYKLQIVNQDDSTSEYDKQVVVSPQISSARHTWGSIKAMFR